MSRIDNGRSMAAKAERPSVAFPDSKDYVGLNKGIRETVSLGTADWQSRTPAASIIQHE
jgi:hypothetical protein